jgi:pimeloyl-ACP methyl ester carboxylesterase
MMPFRDATITTRDGRTLTIQEGGAADGIPLLVQGGTPNSRLLYAPDAARAERAGIRMISYDRPGYGGSTAQPGHTVADCAADVRAIAASLGIERLIVMGASGGGPRALACAALAPDLVAATAVLCSLAPYDAPGLDYFGGMGQLNVEDIRLMLDDPAAAREKLEDERREMLAADAAGLIEYLRTLLSPVDAAVLTGEMVEYFIAAARDGLAPGGDGWWDDSLSMMVPWGFDLGAIATPVLLRHGRQDRFVPFAHGEWLAAHVPGATALLTDDDGHLTLTVNHLESIFAWLVERF